MDSIARNYFNRYVSPFKRYVFILEIYIYIYSISHIWSRY